MTFAKLVPKTSKTDCIRLSYSHQAPTWSHTVTHSPCASPWTPMPSGHRGQLSAACPGPRKMVPFLKFLRSSLKRFEEIGSSLKPSTVLQVYFTTSKPHDAGTPLQPAWYQPPQPVPSSQHESHFGTLTWPKTGSANAKKNMLTTSCNSPLSKSWRQLNFNKESSNQIWFKPY